MSALRVLQSSTRGLKPRSREVLEDVLPCYSHCPMLQSLPQDWCNLVIVPLFHATSVGDLLDERSLESPSRPDGREESANLSIIVGCPSTEIEAAVPLHPATRILAADPACLLPILDALRCFHSVPATEAGVHQYTGLLIRITSSLHRDRICSKSVLLVQIRIVIEAAEIPLGVQSFVCTNEKRDPVASAGTSQHPPTRSHGLMIIPYTTRQGARQSPHPFPSCRRSSRMAANMYPRRSPGA